VSFGLAVRHEVGTVAFEVVWYDMLVYGLLYSYLARDCAGTLGR